MNVYNQADAVVQLLEEIGRLKAENARLKAREEEVWGIVEDVACGTKLECTRCGKPRPCMCQDGGN